MFFLKKIDLGNHTGGSGIVPEEIYFTQPFGRLYLVLPPSQLHFLLASIHRSASLSFIASLLLFDVTQEHIFPRTKAISRILLILVFYFNSFYF